MTHARKLIVLSLCLVLPLTSCRSWTRYKDVSLADMSAGVALYLQEHYPHRSLGTPDRGGSLEVEFYSQSHPLFTLLFALMTAGTVIPISDSAEVAVRSDGRDGSELAVEAISHWQIMWFIPTWHHERPREQAIRAEILENAKRRRDDQRRASEAVYALLDAVRTRDSAAFAALLWSQHEHRAHADLWLGDDVFWTAPRLAAHDSLTVSWPPHVRRWETKSFFGLATTTHRYECLWVDVTFGTERMRFELAKEHKTGAFRLILPLAPDGALRRSPR